MSENELRELADKAKFIVSGYAFSAIENNLIEIVNLEHPEGVMIINSSGELIETNMDEIEQKIVLELSGKNLQFMEVADA